MKGPGFYGEDFFIIKEDNDLIRENITRILLTAPKERVMSTFGSRFKAFIFDPTTVLQEEVTAEIRKSISRWEPSVNIDEITAEMVDDSKVEVLITLTNKETLETFSYEAIIRL